MADTARVQYAFFDIVRFTEGRTVEAQSDVIRALNEIVKAAIASLPKDYQEQLFLPTGDGMAVAIFNAKGADVHLQLALEVLKLTAQRNTKTTDAKRRFDVRIGINENMDNVIVDINGARNVAGAGISMAQRIVDQADAGQILVGQTVYEVLRHREKYYEAFRPFSGRGKHGITFPVYQFIGESEGLNADAPSAFAAKQSVPAKLTKLAAYYMAHSLKHQKFLSGRRSDPTRDCVAVVLLTYLAQDAVQADETPSHDEVEPKTWGAGHASFEQQYEHYGQLDYWTLVDLALLLQEKHLAPYAGYFDGGSDTCHVFVAEEGVKKLKTEWPDLAKQAGV
jgi:class 3 adenylate cyclase